MKNAPSTYQQDFTTRGLFEPDIASFTIGKTKYSVCALKTVNGSNSAIAAARIVFSTVPARQRAILKKHLT
jgi:hypothetical protein